MPTDDLYAGLDLGTSGVRLCVIDANKNIISETSQHYPNPQQQSAQLWWQHSRHLLQRLPTKLKQRLRYLAIDGTSGTVLLTDSHGEALTNPLLYNDHDANFHWHNQAQL